MPRKDYAPLWTVAAQSLGIDINFGDSETHQVVQEALDLAKEKQEYAAKKTFKFKGRNGQSVPFRDVYARIATYLQKFKEVGDIAVQYDTANASLPWAGVRLFLQLAINDNEIYSTILQGMELASELIARSAISETLYLSQEKLPAHLVEQARQALLKLYVEILRFLHYGMKYFGQKTLPRVLNGVIRPAETTIMPMVLAMAQAEEKLSSLSRLLDAHLAQEAASTVEIEVEKLSQQLAELHGPSQELHEQVQELSKALHQAEDGKLMNWLSTIPYRQHHENTRKGRLDDSGSWLLDKAEYTEWVESQASALFWLHGIPGSGKTKLASVVIDEVKARSEKRFNVSLTACFYCARDSGLKPLSDPDEVLRSILRQLCTSGEVPGMTGLVREVYQASSTANDEAAKLDISTCRDLIFDIADILPIYIVIDALDECDPTRRHELLQALIDLTKTNDHLIKVFISSRDDGDLRRRLITFPNVPILMSDNSKDITRFTSREVSTYIENGRLLDGFVSQELKNDIIHILESKAQGMFLWVSLQLENLCDPQRMLMEEDVRNELGQLPSSLANLYTAACDQIERSGPTTKSIARATLKWLMCCLRPLTIEEALGAVSVDFESRVTELNAEQMIGMCRNLVIHDRDQNVLHFAHLSVRDYLEERAEYAISENEITAAERCLDVVTTVYNPMSAPNQGLRQNVDLKEYATLFWPFHFRNIELLQRHDRLERKLFRFLFRGDPMSNSFTHWIKAALASSKLAGLPDVMISDLAALECYPPTPLFTACVFGLSTMVTHIKRSDPTTLERTNSAGQSALSLAMEHGHFHVVQALLEPESTGKKSDPTMRTPSSSQDGKDPTVVYYIAALEAAIRSNNTMAINAILLRGREVVNGKSFLDHTFEAAAWIGDDKTISILMKAGGELKNLQIGPIGKILTRATRKGMEDFVGLLLDKGHGPMLGHQADSLLWEATAIGNTKLVKLYLEYGASVQPLVEYDGRTAFHIAAERGHDECIRLLFEYSRIKDGVAEAKMKIGIKSATDGSTALHIAVEKDWFSITILLLDLGAPYSMDSAIFSPFMNAAKNGRLDLVKAFIEKQEVGALVNKKEWLNKTALHWAAEFGYTEMCVLLIGNGADPLLKDTDGNTPLNYAVWRERKPTVELLLKVMPMRYPTDDKSWLNQKTLWTTNYLTTVARPDLLQLLLHAGADPLTRMHGHINNRIREVIEGVDHRFTALQYFIYRKLWDCGILLVEYIDYRFGRQVLKKHLAIKDELEGKSTLHWAVKMGDLEFVRFLLEYEADVNSKDKKGHTAEYYAEKDKQMELVALLKKYRSDGTAYRKPIKPTVEDERRVLGLV